MQNMTLAYSSKCYSVTGVDKVTIFSSHNSEYIDTWFTEIFGIHGNVCSSLFMYWTRFKARLLLKGLNHVSMWIQNSVRMITSFWEEIIQI